MAIFLPWYNYHLFIHWLDYIILIKLNSETGQIQNFIMCKILIQYDAKKQKQTTTKQGK